MLARPESASGLLFICAVCGVEPFVLIIDILFELFMPSFKVDILEHSVDRVIELLYFPSCCEVLIERCLFLGDSAPGDELSRPILFEEKLPLLLDVFKRRELLS